MNSSTTSIDPYHTLCLEPNATLEDAKAAFRRLAKQFHPDVNKSSDAAEKFRRINAAFEAIKSGAKPSKRQWTANASQPRYKVYEIVNEHAFSATIIRSEPVFEAGTEIHVMKGSKMFKFHLDKRRRLPFDVTVKGTKLMFRNPPEGF